MRRGEPAVPYIVHPQNIVDMLAACGEPAESSAVSIAWGHDLLEDTVVSESEIIRAAGREVLDAVKLLTCPKDMDKQEYLRNIAACGNRNVLLVKLVDRICNARDFIRLNGALYALRYLRSADCLLPALKVFTGDRVVENMLVKRDELCKSLRKESYRDAVRGCLLGGAVGDALGSPVEFIDLRGIKLLYGDLISDYVEYSDGTGAITDDTQMTIFTAEGLLRAKVGEKSGKECNLTEMVHHAYLRWLKTQYQQPDAPENIINSGWLVGQEPLHRVRAPGSTCIAALNCNSTSHLADNNSKGCGTVMRMAPVGLCLEPEAAYRYGCEFSAITHGHPSGVTAGGAFAMLISYLRDGIRLDESLDLVEKYLSSRDDAGETLAAIRHARYAESVAELGEGWIAEEALAIGIFCALHHQSEFKTGVLDAVNIVGDSDSTGSIAGNILGVINGEQAIPEEWRRNLREYDIVSQVADDLSIGIQLASDGSVSSTWQDKYPGF